MGRLKEGQPMIQEIHSPDLLDRAKIKLLNDRGEVFTDLVAATWREVNAVRQARGMPPIDPEQRRRMLLEHREAQRKRSKVRGMLASKTRWGA